jgi:propionyl-CoA carboxylase beta chain
MGSEGAVNIIHRRAIEKAADPERERSRLTAEYREKFANPYVAAERGYVDEVILPRDTRRKLITSLEMLESKRDTMPPKKHGSIPL